MQDTDDRIPKDSIYGTIRMKRRENAASEELARVEEDVDSLPPPPADDQVMIMMMMIVMVIMMMMTRATMTAGISRPPNPLPGSRDTTRMCW